MKAHSDEEPDIESQREKIIGLGKLSIRKSYYPELQQKHAELMGKNEELHAAYEELTATQEELQVNYDELSKKEQELREGEARLRSILHASPVMQFVIDRDHHVITWNRAIESYSGIAADEIVGTDGQWRAFYEKKRPVLADILLDQALDLLPELYTEKFSKSRFVDDGYEVAKFFPKMGIDGKWLHVTAVPIRDAKGEIIGAIETLEDITEQRDAETALQKSEKFLNSVFENIPNMIFVKDARDLRFVRFNKAGEDLLGYSQEELSGKNDYDFFPEEEADFFTKNDREVLDHRQVVDIPEEKIRTRLLGERILHTKKIAIPDESGKPTHLMGISEDITERRRMENALQLARNKINLLNTVTFQDIQSAAFSLSAYHELFRTLVKDETAKMFLDKQISITRKIIESLNFAKNYQEMGVRPPRWQNVNQVFLLAISHLDFLKITRDTRVEGLEVYADPLLENVFFQMMQNVLTYGGHATRITLRYEEKADRLVLFVEDDGVGIPAEEKLMIFDRGYGKKSGLGLFLAREVLSITDMTIKETGEPGKGARFEIFVPKESYRICKDPPKK
ncbi:MAG: PAS domain S-box protein [Methanoregula sp.]